MRHETSTDYRNPYRPGLIKLANRLSAPFRVSLDADDLIRSATKKTKLDDLGDPSFRQPLEILLRSIDEEAGVHSIGRLITRTRIVSMLATRLRLEDLLARRPEIERERLTRPIVIVGLPRTGTTFLHRLLASDTTRIRALLSWEALMPIADDDAHGERRIASALRGEKALKYLAPDFFAVHPIDARGPEEEILLLDLAFRSTVPEATLHVPTYARWLESADQAPAYRQMARALKALQWQRKPTEPNFRWVLKTPHHLEWLEELPKVLDEPLIVWTHRAPADVVGSFCSMVAHGRGVFSDRVDPFEIGREWGLRKGKRMVERALDARSSIGEANIIDVRYTDLIRDPLAVARLVQERSGLPWNATTEARLQASLGREKKDRHGVHRYALSDFGLSEADVDAAFSRYRSAVGV